METKEHGRAPRGALAGLALLAAIAAAGGPAEPQAAAQVYGVALPDLWNKTLAVRPKKVQAGGTVEIVSAVRNLGAADFLAPPEPPSPDVPAAGTEEDGAPAPPPAVRVRFVLVANVRHREGVEAGSWGFGALKRREIVRHSLSWTVPDGTAPGLWFLCADVDPDNAVRESNEMNNRTCYPLTVELPPETVAGTAAEAAETETPEAEESGGPPQE